MRKIKEGFVLRKVADQYVVIATGEASRDFHGMIKLNQVGADIWEGLNAGSGVEEIADRIVEKYEVDRAKAEADIEALVRRIEEAGFLE